MTKASVVPGVIAATAVAIAGGLLAAWTWQNNADQIATNERNYQLRGLNEIIPPDRYDNSLFDDTIEVRDPDLLGTADSLTVYRARSNGQPVAVVMNAVAPRGYSAAIHLLVGINYDGSVAGVRVSEHRETAGLGDQIEIEKSDWITGFDRQSLQSPPVNLWLVKKDGGNFDQISGATVTPRAIVRAVRDALIYFEQNREELFASRAAQ